MAAPQTTIATATRPLATQAKHPPFILSVMKCHQVGQGHKIQVCLRPSEAPDSETRGHVTKANNDHTGPILVSEVGPHPGSSCWMIVHRMAWYSLILQPRWTKIGWFYKWAGPWLVNLYAGWTAPMVWCVIFGDTGNPIFNDNVKQCVPNYSE